MPPCSVSTVDPAIMSRPAMTSMYLVTVILALPTGMTSITLSVGKIREQQHAAELTVSEREAILRYDEVDLKGLKGAERVAKLQKKFPKLVNYNSNLSDTLKKWRQRLGKTVADRENNKKKKAANHFQQQTWETSQCQTFVHK